MKPSSHKVITELAFQLLDEINISFPYSQYATEIANESEATDYYLDLEFIDVTGLGFGGRDNPHKDEKYTINDEPHKIARVLQEDYYFTSFNHYIDIQKGPGLFDDYDGYSFRYGSASKDQYQSVGDAASNSSAQFLSKLVGKFNIPIKLDEAINWWFSDEYVHAPGHEWYDNCSPSVSQYSFYGDKGIYKSIEEESKARFPLANSIGKKGKGIPYSVFMPVDNMARFYFNNYLAESKPKFLGPVMHAIQDASIPHHAAGIIGNWHGRYETELADKILAWEKDDQFKNDIKLLFSRWRALDNLSPNSLRKQDYNKIPSVNWSIEMLVTWLAINAYKDYSGTFYNFRNGYATNEQATKELTKKATAMSMLALCKAVKHMATS